jgi:hypothetical protein
MKPETKISIYDITQKPEIFSKSVTDNLQYNPAKNIYTSKRVLDEVPKLHNQQASFSSSLRILTTNITGIMTDTLINKILKSILSSIEKITTFSLSPFENFDERHCV